MSTEVGGKPRNRNYLRHFTTVRDKISLFNCFAFLSFFFVTTNNMEKVGLRMSRIWIIVLKHKVAKSFSS